MLPVTLNPRLAPVEHDPFQGPALAAALPLTDAQKEVWLAAVMDPGANLSYNEGIRLNLDGRLDVPALAASLQTVVDRHEALRGTIGPGGETLGVREALEVALPVTDLSKDAAPQAAAEAAERDLMGQAFNLETGPLLRLALLKLADNQHRLIFIAHHVICDGWSAAVILTELAALYSARVEGRTADLYTPQRFGDYAITEQNFLDSSEGREHTAYWLERLKDAPPALDLPPDLPRPARRGWAADRYDHPLSEKLVSRLKATGAAANASLVATMLASFSALLHRLSGATDMVIGLSAAGQALHNQLKLVGHAVNLLPLRLHPSSDQAFLELLADTRKQVLDAFDHQGTTFGALLPKLKVERDTSRPPLVSVIFNIDVRDDNISHTGLKVTYDTLIRQGENFDLYVNVVDNGKNLLLECSYNTALYTRDGIEARMREWEAMLEQVAEHPETKVGELPLLSSAERRQIVETFNQTTKSVPLEVPVVRHFERYAGETPEATALVFENETWTYARLHIATSKLARWLTNAGVKKGDLVGVVAERGPFMVMSLLAVQKAGAAYLPLDPAYPPERLAFMARDAACPVILTAIEQMPEDLAAWLKAPEQGGLKVLDLPGEFDAAVEPLPEVSYRVETGPKDLAYCIYTSGSTGKPKGVLIENAGFANRLLWMQEQYPLSATDKVLQKTPYSFDVSVWEFFWPLMRGATMVIAPPDAHKDPLAIAELIQKAGVTVCHFVPSALVSFLEEPASAACTSLRDVFCSGEALPFDLTRRFYRALPEAKLHNLYGPTEASVDVTYWDVPKDAGPKVLVPIGRPVYNTKLFILNPAGEPVPVGVAGELFLEGIQLARGYLNRDDLTAERFITHPEFGRLYKTGDAARWLKDGTVDYLGRLDFQVKLRGFRIELGEIEASANQHPAVLESAAGVAERAAGDKRLALWYATRPGEAEVSASEIRSHLRHTLPEHMIPQHIVSMDELPHLTSGKINRNSLPAPFGDDAAKLRTPPATPAEEAVAKVWQEMLGLSTVGREDRFFDLGGHSLLAVQATARLKELFGTRIPLRVVMMEPLAAVAEAAGVLRAAQPEAAAAAPAKPISAPLAPPPPPPTRLNSATAPTPGPARTESTDADASAGKAAPRRGGLRGLLNDLISR